MKQLFEPYNLTDKVVMRNRLVMAPMTTWSGNKDGSVSKDELAYYKARAGGVGMVVTATTYTVAHGKGFSGQFFGGDDGMLDSLASLAKVIKTQGALAVLQVFHAGRKANPDHMPDGITRSASNVPGNRLSNNHPKEMTEDEIQVLIDSFYEVTIRAARAGFDGIEIHGANTYLIQQFFSPHANIRKDRWGGSLEKRMNLPLAIIDAVLRAKEAINHPDFLVGYRFSPEENHSPGISLKETEHLVDRLCKTDLDYLHISLGDYKQGSIREGEDHGSSLKRLVETIEGRKPFIGVGSIYSLEAAEDALSYGVDMVALGRQLLVDPKTVEKWMLGHKAWKLYDPDKRRECVIPKPLHQVMMDNKGWVPTLERE